ncbi:MAG: NAD(P)-binding protein [Lachnospiraceae bacterium]|nr:NAD(P)-binding protein [Lachnospiraceae bacterium]
MKYLILGAGPSGLTLAAKLIEKGIKDLLVLEKEKEAGGLCRSRDVDGSPFDIGGGHFLDVRRPAVTEFLFKYMPENEWDRYERDSRIDLKGRVIGSPIEANIWMLDTDTQIEYLKAIAEAGSVSGAPMPERFTEWIYWKLGKRIAEDYMLPYNKKMFGEELDSLGTYWLEKLPDVSFEDTLRSCLEHRAYARQPGHSEFFYPKKYGYGELWKRVAESLGDCLKTGVAAEKLDIAEKCVNDEYKADVIINTVPWTDFREIKGAAPALKKSIENLRYSSIVTEYHEERMDTAAHWIYYPDEEKDFHRILVRHNFCPDSKGYWTETNLTRYRESGKEHFVSKYAYPLNTIGKNELMTDILSEMKEHGIFGLGRWGEWQHYNSDVVAERAMILAEELTGE